MNNITPEQKQPVIKLLAIAGLIAVIIFIAWLAVLIVQILPSAISSLASTASSVYSRNPLQTNELRLQNNDTLVNVNQPFALSWSKPYENGTYTFSYSCLENVTLNLRVSGKEFSDLECNRSYDLGEADALTLSINTNKERFTDVSYTISLFKPNSQTPVTSVTATTTIVNADIVIVDQNPTSPTATSTINEKPKEETVSTSSATSTEVTVKPKPTPKPTKPTVTTKPTPVPVYTYAIPTSKPYGTPDLVVSYIGIGNIDKSGAFVKTGVIRENTTNGALQFSVHNVGNKTSDAWSYVAKLPDNINYQSKREEPLLPNERAVITIPFSPIADSTYRTFSVVVDTKNDANLNTNSFLTSALVLK